METNKSCPKPKFGWSSYEKAFRKLTKTQEATLLHGHLRPILDYVLQEPEVRLDVRPGKANLYYDGGNLLRLEGGARTPFIGVFDRGYAGGSGLERRDLSDSSAVERAVRDFGEHRAHMLKHGDSGHGRAERRYEQHIARANDARTPSAAGDFVIFDIEYAYARRRFDFVLFDRAGLPRPRLVFGELKCRAGALHGSSGLQCHGEDFGELLCAESGRHVEIAKCELSGLIKQKKRLGLLSPQLAFEGFASDPPEFWVIFADYDVRQRALDTALSRLRAEIVKRLGSLELLKFVDLPEVDDGSASLMRLRREKVMDSDQFDAFRHRTV